MTVRWPPFQVTPFGKDFIVRCSECGELKQVQSTEEGRSEGRAHQRWEHPTDEEQMLDHLRMYEYGGDMDKFCARCGVEGHEGRNCPTVTPDLLKSGKGQHH